MGMRKHIMLISLQVGVWWVFLVRMVIYTQEYRTCYYASSLGQLCVSPRIKWCRNHLAKLGSGQRSRPGSRNTAMLTSYTATKCSIDVLTSETLSLQAKAGNPECSLLHMYWWGKPFDLCNGTTEVNTLFFFWIQERNPLFFSDDI